MSLTLRWPRRVKPLDHLGVQKGMNFSRHAAYLTCKRMVTGSSVSELQSFKNDPSKTQSATTVSYGSRLWHDLAHDTL